MRPISPEGVCGAPPLAAPSGLSLRSAPRRAQRAASEERASNERGTSEHRGRRSAVRPSRCVRWSAGGRSVVGRCGRARPSRCGRQAVGRRSVGSVRSALRAHPHRPRGSGRTRAAAPPRGVGPWRARPHRRGGVGVGARLRHSSRPRGALRP